jgi:hypothetical protein
MDFVLLVTFLSLVVIAGASGFVGYCMGRQAGSNEGYKLGFHDGTHDYPPQGSYKKQSKEKRYV